MAISSRKTELKIQELLNAGSLESHINHISPKMPDDKPLPPDIPDQRSWSKEAFEKRIDFLEHHTKAKLTTLASIEGSEDPESLRGNIENYIGNVRVPTGIIGPLRINGTYANDDFYIPLSTTEGAMVASYNRGAKAASLSGGVTSVCLTEGIQRAPSFVFSTFSEAGSFLIWVMAHLENYKAIVADHTSHGQLVDVRPNVDGNMLTLIFEYTTGDASGQNMVTICTDAICKYIEAECPIKPVFWVVEGNLSGDKKATSISFTHVRGKKVTAEVVLKSHIIEKNLHATPEKMMKYWQVSAVNGVQSGSIGINGHFANGLTALFLATGQDVATVSEAAVGTTRMNLTPEGDLYVCVTLPNLVVGTVGGGTRFATQQECLNLLGCNGNGHAKKFAEICAAMVLCGEISIIAALSAGDFTRAHMLYGRRSK